MPPRRDVKEEKLIVEFSYAQRRRSQRLSL
jgi:hypothetical protein